MNPHCRRCGLTAIQIGQNPRLRCERLSAELAALRPAVVKAQLTADIKKEHAS